MTSVAPEKDAEIVLTGSAHTRTRWWAGRGIVVFTVAAPVSEYVWSTTLVSTFDVLKKLSSVVLVFSSCGVK